MRDWAVFQCKEKFLIRELPKARNQVPERGQEFLLAFLFKRGETSNSVILISDLFPKYNKMDTFFYARLFSVPPKYDLPTHYHI